MVRSRLHLQGTLKQPIFGSVGNEHIVTDLVDVLTTRGLPHLTCQVELPAKVPFCRIHSQIINPIGGPA